MEQGPLDFKFHQLPLARVKKVMKADEDAKVQFRQSFNHLPLNAEAPMIFSKACEIFIIELTMRAWIHTEEHKRRTLQRSDVATAISKSDQYDFLIDIVPRDEINKPPSMKVTGTPGTRSSWDLMLTLHSLRICLPQPLHTTKTPHNTSR
ncbi:histone-fold-containing protein [Powellomyces hirtus]|nr:histone-fold-containing protein [Powellomyces hirtus]